MQAFRQAGRQDGWMEWGVEGWMEAWIAFFYCYSCVPHRWVLCTNHTEPVKGFLGRFLRRKLIETEIDKNMRSNDLIKIVDWIPKTWHHLNSFLEAHSSSDVTIGALNWFLESWEVRPSSSSDTMLIYPHRPPPLPAVPNGCRGFSGLVYRPLELLPGSLSAGGCQRRTAGTDVCLKVQLQLSKVQI